MLSDLIAALEGQTAPGPKLDRQIAAVLGWVTSKDMDTEGGWFAPDGTHHPALPPFTMDLAIAWFTVEQLGWYPSVRRLGLGLGEPGAAPHHGVAATVARTPIVQGGTWFLSFARTPAMGLMACLMKAEQAAEKARPQRTPMAALNEEVA